MSPNSNGHSKGSILERISSRTKSFPIEIEVFSATKYSPPLFVVCEYQDGKDMEDIVRQSMVRGRNGQLEPDNEKYMAAFCRKHIRGWSNFTLEYAYQLMPKRIESLSTDEWYEMCDADGFLPYSEEDAELVYREAPAELFFMRIRDGIAVAAKAKAEAKAQEIFEAQKNFATLRATNSASVAGSENPAGVPVSTAT